MRPSPVIVALALLVGSLDLKQLATSPPEVTFSRWGKPLPSDVSEYRFLDGRPSDAPTFRQASALRKKSKPKRWHRTVTYRWRNTDVLRKDGLQEATMVVEDDKMKGILAMTIPRPGAWSEVRGELYRSLGLEAPKPSPGSPDPSYFPSLEGSVALQITSREITLPTKPSAPQEDPPLTYINVSMVRPSSRPPLRLWQGESFFCSVAFGTDGTPRYIGYSLPLEESSLDSLARVGLRPRDLHRTSEPEMEGVKSNFMLSFNKKWKVEWVQIYLNPGEVNPAIPAYGYAAPDYCSLRFER